MTAPALDERLGRAPSPVDPVIEAAIRAVFGMSERDMLTKCNVPLTTDAVFLDYVSEYALKAWNSTLKLATKRIERTRNTKRNGGVLSAAQMIHIVQNAAYYPVILQRARAHRDGVDYLTGQPL
jgi:hypothetical protein